ncbi:MAG: hypothetical protein NTU53_13630, partial [Planctomycetota bacterium]|nr:hypothetical protein [Planctomycetota bacterium]
VQLLLVRADAAPMAARALAKVHASHVRGLGRSPLVVAGVAVIPGHRPSHLRGARGGGGGEWGLRAWWGQGGEYAHLLRHAIGSLLLSIACLAGCSLAVGLSTLWPRCTYAAVDQSAARRLG